MAHRKRNPWFALAEKVLFRVAFAGFIVVEFVVFVLLLVALSWVISAISNVAPEDNSVFLGSLIALILIGPFAVGASSYLIFQRLTRAEYLAAESERWLAERKKGSNGRTKSLKIIKRWALWIPTVTVILVCVFFDDAWPIATHLLDRGRGRLTGYEVAIPLTWSIAYFDLRRQGDANNIVVVERYRGLIKAGSGPYLGTRRPLSISNINFRSCPGGHPVSVEPLTEIISVRVLPFTKGTIECHEDVLPRWMTSGHYIRCFTPTGDFSANFNGIDADVAAFYQMLGSVKRDN